MSQISYPWNGNAVGDAVLSPYEADSVFASILSVLSRARSYPNQGYVLDTPNAGNSLAPTVAGGIVSIATGAAVVNGTVYNSDSIVAFTIPDNPPSGSTRIDRIVLRKDWAAQTVRLLYLEGSPASGGGAEPSLTATDGVTWDIPLASISTTTGGASTVTDERPLSAGGAAGSSVFVPWTASGPFPTTHFTAVAPFLNTPVTLSGVPSNATAVMVTWIINSGTINVLQFATLAGGATVSYELTGPTNPTTVPSPILIPIAPGFPAQISLSNAAAIDLYLEVVGWYIPL